MQKLSDLVRIKDRWSEATIYDYLIGALAEEYIAWYFYLTIGNFLVGEERSSIENFFKETANDELNDHAAWLIKRIDELDLPMIELFEINSWNMKAFHSYSVPHYFESGKVSTKDALLKAINMESEAIETYTHFEEATRLSDPVTNQKIKEILADEEEHLAELKNFWEDLELKQRKTIELNNL